MNVAFLMSQLRSMPPDAEVELEGCDCVEALGYVRLATEAPYTGRVFLLRHDDGCMGKEFPDVQADRDEVRRGRRARGEA